MAPDRSSRGHWPRRRRKVPCTGMATGHACGVGRRTILPSISSEWRHNVLFLVGLADGWNCPCIGTFVQYTSIVLRMCQGSLKSSAPKSEFPDGRYW